MEWNVEPNKVEVTINIPDGTYTKEFDSNTKLADVVMSVANEYNLSNVTVKDSSGNEIDSTEENKNKAVGEFGNISITSKTAGA